MLQLPESEESDTQVKVDAQSPQLEEKEVLKMMDNDNNYKIWYQQ